MDTSQTYIKMRLAAIPDMGRGDTTLTGHITQMFGNDAVMDEYGNYYAGCRSMCFKLERQDQLQEMVIYGTLNKDGLGSLLSRFWVFCSCKYMGEPTFWVFISMEQLWLAFAMKQHNKIWDGERWCDEEEQVGTSD